VVKIGYSRPRAIRGIHPSGLREVMVWRPRDLEGIDPNTHVAKIAHTVGENKRVLIIEEAKKRSIRVLNPGLKKAPEQVAPEPKPEETPAETTSEEPHAEEKTAEKKSAAKGKSKRSAN
jgi:large subunit ribosomal protein L32e